MGKGDKKSRKGKQSIGSYGNSRPQNQRNKETQMTNSVSVKPSPVLDKKDVAPVKKTLKTKA